MWYDKTPCQVYRYLLKKLPWIIKYICQTSTCWHPVVLISACNNSVDIYQEAAYDYYNSFITRLANPNGLFCCYVSCYVLFVCWIWPVTIYGLWPGAWQDDCHMRGRRFCITLLCLWCFELVCACLSVLFYHAQGRIAWCLLPSYFCCICMLSIHLENEKNNCYNSYHKIQFGCHQSSTSGQF